MYFYQKGCWFPRRLSDIDHEHDANDDNNLSFEFRHDLLDPARVDVPLSFVNREARGIALAWVCEERIDMGFRKDGRCYMFVHRFDPVRDGLYVALDKWYKFCCEAYDRLFQPDLLDKNVSSDSDIRHIAAPETLVWSGINEIPEMFDWLTGVTVLFIIVEPQHKLQLEAEQAVQRRLKMAAVPERAFCWNHDHERFELRGGDYIGGEALYRRIERACEWTSEILTRNHIRRF